MKISIIIPIYKVEKYLRQCVDSVLCQTYRDIEVILVDDGSPDLCPQICDEYARMDARVSVIHKQNGGLSDARNKGIENATGAYGVFIDADDYWDDSGALSKLVNRLSLLNADVLNFGYYKYYEDSGKKIAFAENEPSMPLLYEKKERLDYLANHGLIVASACNKLVRMDILKRIHFEKGRLSEDIEWTAKLICSDIDFDYIAVSFYCYRQRGGSISQSISSSSCDNLKEAIIGCCVIDSQASEISKYCIDVYTAYQFATFIAVQALADAFQSNNIRNLREYKEILKYYGSNKKVKYMYYGTHVFGLAFWCLIIRISKMIWNRWRDKI